MRKSPTILLLCFLAIAPHLTEAGSVGFAEKTGKHFGEENFLEYFVEYLDPLGVTTVSETGITFAPFSGAPIYSSGILPENYFGDYPLYFSGGTLKFRVYIKNIGARAYRNLKVFAWQEFLDTSGAAGDPFPDQNFSEWFVENIGAREEIVLGGELKIPSAGSSGIDQTHIQILHWDGKNSDKAHIGGGEVIVDDPQAGLWCPVR